MTNTCQAVARRVSNVVSGLAWGGDMDMRTDRKAAKYRHCAWPAHDRVSNGAGAHPHAAAQAGGQPLRPDLGTVLPGGLLHVQAGEDAVALARADVLARAQALARLDGAVGLYGGAGLDAPAGLQVHHAADGTAHHDALPRAQAARAADIAAHAQALVAGDAAVHGQVPADEGAGAHRERAAAHHVPRGAQVAAAVQAALAADAGARADVLTRHDGAAGAYAAARVDGAARMDHAIHLDTAAHLYGAGEHHGLGLQAVHAEHGVRGAELAQQPQRVVHAAGGDELVQRLLVAHAILDVAHEPAEAVGARALGPKKLLGEFHATLQSLGVVAPRAARAPGAS